MTISLRDYTEAYAVPGEDHLIDIINPQTRLTSVYGKTFEQVREEYPDAQLVNIDEFCADKGSRQDTEIEWSEVTEERYFEMFECLPPAAYGPNAFLVGEPYDHHAVSGQPRYGCFQKKAGKYLAASRPMTRKEFWAFTGINPVCGIEALCPDDLIRPCILVKGHAGFCDGGVK